MDEALTESPAFESRRWIGRFLIAVVLGEAIWGFLVSITTNLALPAMARVLGGDEQSPLNLGRGEFNVPALFAAVLELFFAGIIAVILNAWTQRPGRVRVKVVRQAAPRATSVPSISPSSVPAAPAVTAPPVAPVTAPVEAAPAPTVVAVTPPATLQAEPSAPVEKRAPQPVAAEKLKKPKKVYYNIVGEAIESDDE